MHSYQIEKAREQFNAFRLFECCYVNPGKREATYALSRAGEVDFNDVLWFRTVNVLTGAITQEGCLINRNDYAELISALESHYNPEFIKSDGIVLSMEFSADAECYVKDGKNQMHKHVVFGQSIHYADVDELSGETADTKEEYIL